MRHVVLGTRPPSPVILSPGDALRCAEAGRVPRTWWVLNILQLLPRLLLLMFLLLQTEHLPVIGTGPDISVYQYESRGWINKLTHGVGKP